MTSISLRTKTVWPTRGTLGHFFNIGGLTVESENEKKKINIFTYILIILKFNTISLIEKYMVFTETNSQTV